jgi:hypothetical protein
MEPGASVGMSGTTPRNAGRLAQEATDRPLTRCATRRSAHLDEFALDLYDITDGEEGARVLALGAPLS